MFPHSNFPPTHPYPDTWLYSPLAYSVLGLSPSLSPTAVAPVPTVTVPNKVHLTIFDKCPWIFFSFNNPRLQQHTVTSGEVRWGPRSKGRRMVPSILLAVPCPMQFKTYLGEHDITISTGGKQGCHLEGPITEQGSLSHQERDTWPSPEGCLARGTEPARGWGNLPGCNWWGGAHRGWDVCHPHTQGSRWETVPQSERWP